MIEAIVKGLIVTPIIIFLWTAVAIMAALVYEVFRG